MLFSSKFFFWQNQDEICVDVDEDAPREGAAGGAPQGRPIDEVCLFFSSFSSYLTFFCCWLMVDKLKEMVDADAPHEGAECGAPQGRTTHKVSKLFL